MYDDLEVTSLFGDNTEQTLQEEIEKYEEEWKDGATLSDKKSVADMQKFMNFLG